MKIYDINWAKVRSVETLANEMLKVAISMKQTPKNTHVINWRHVPENKALLYETWHEWSAEFPNMLHDNLIRLSPRYAKKQAKKCKF